MNAERDDHRVVGASEVAQTVAQIVPGLSERDRVVLRDLLGHDLAAPSAAALRHARLGLLIRLCRDGFNGSPADYEEARQGARDEGEDWPAAATLCSAYGHWATAKRCAQRFAEKGGAARVPHNMHHAQGRRRSPTRMDVLDAIRMAKRSLDTWPTPWEYLEFAQLERRAARLRGNSEPELPTMKRICNAWGDYATALREAWRLEDGSTEGAGGLATNAGPRAATHDRHCA